MDSTPPYNEALLHWLWKNRHLRQANLSTRSGESVQVHHPGYPNASDGPDFTNARISIGSLKWHGDVEIHWTSRDWTAHQHHTDANYNRVILHVVFDDAHPADIFCADGSTPPTLYIKPFLSQPLQSFFQHFQKPNRLPCAGNIASVPEEVIEKQFARAHNEYFEQKVNDWLHHFDATLPLSRAWPRMLILALFDGLGIAHNRAPMRKLAIELWVDDELTANTINLIQKALRLAGIQPENPNAPFRWKRKGSRPANHPETRIKQGCELLKFIHKKPFSWWLRTAPDESYRQVIDSVKTDPGIGNHRSGILFGTVWLPCYYLLGDLTGAQRLCSTSKKMWIKHRTRIPASIAKPFKQCGIPPAVYEQKLGTVHQYRAYCLPKKCQQCSVFKSVISS